MRGDTQPCESPNRRLLLSRFAVVGKDHSPCGSRSRATSIAAQQKRKAVRKPSCRYERADQSLRYWAGFKTKTPSTVFPIRWPKWLRSPVRRCVVRARMAAARIGRSFSGRPQDAASMPQGASPTTTTFSRRTSSLSRGSPGGRLRRASSMAKADVMSTESPRLQSLSRPESAR